MTATEFEETSRPTGHELVKDLLTWFSFVESLVLFLASTAMAVLSGICVWYDLNYSVIPMRKAHVPQVIGWVFSLLSSVTELLVGLNTDIGKAFAHNLPQTKLANVDKRQLAWIVKVNWAMLGYDIITNIYGAWVETSPVMDPLAHFTLSLFVAAVLTLSELFFVFFTALSLACGKKAWEAYLKIRK